MELNLNPIMAAAVALAVIVLTWIGVLTYQLFSLKKHYNSLIKNTKKGELQAILKEILGAQHRQYDTIAQMQKLIRQIKKDVSYHFQLVGFKRFNPFDDTGGNQSFVLALLDKHKSGLVISSLHNRNITRVYTKQVYKGNTKDIKFSVEEKEVVAMAKSIRA